MKKQLQNQNSAPSRLRVTPEQVRELEIKITYLENHVEAQDRAMLEQSRQIEILARELKKLKDLQPDEGAPPASEKPPHY